eukprot:scaffold87993_cov73-Attheya_sp.AAC.1
MMPSGNGRLSFYTPKVSKPSCSTPSYKDSPKTPTHTKLENEKAGDKKKAAMATVGPKTLKPATWSKSPIGCHPRSTPLESLNMSQSRVNKNIVIIPTTVHALLYMIDFMIEILILH